LDLFSSQETFRHLRGDYTYVNGAVSVQCGDILLHAVAVTVLLRRSEKIRINPNFTACSCSNCALRQGPSKIEIKIRTEPSPDLIPFRVGFREGVWQVRGVYRVAGGGIVQTRGG
jgi:hypothetical protein